MFASPEQQQISTQANALGKDPASTTMVRKQLEKQKQLQKKEQLLQQKRLEPFFRNIEDTENDLEGIQDVMQNQEKERQTAVGMMGKKVPVIDKAVQGIKRNLSTV